MFGWEIILIVSLALSKWGPTDLKQSEAQSACAESIHKGVN